MRSKEVEDAIDKTNQLQQAIKEKGKKFVFYDNENAVIGYECLKTVLSYIKTLEQLPNKISDKIKELEEELKNFDNNFGDCVRNQEHITELEIKIKTLKSIIGE